MTYIDWIALVTGLAGAYINGKNVRISTSVWLVSNVCWIVWGIKTHNWTVVIQNIAFLAINTRTLILRWERP